MCVTYCKESSSVFTAKQFTHITIYKVVHNKYVTTETL